jgi:rhamnose transport system permease protein
MKTLGRFASWETFLGTLTIAIAAVVTFTVPGFDTSFNISQAVAGMSEKALIVLPMVLLIVAREIDLSVASTLALSSVIFGLLLQAAVPLPAAILLTLIAGGLCGAFNGVLVTWLNLPSLLATLGTLAMFRGIAYMLLGVNSVNTFPNSLTNFGNDTISDTLPVLNSIPWTIVPFFILAPLFSIVLHRGVLGRRVFAIGGNPDTALYSGIRMARIRMQLFIASGVTCSLAGIIFTARLSNARADNALGFELDVITIVLLGGISVFGGKGRLLGALWALVLVALIRNVLGLNLIGGDAQGTVIGSLLIISLLASSSARAIFATLPKFGRSPRSNKSE